ncbi:MAG: SpoIIE family protein phosphatase [Saprospiraceae bacterium]|nr:SpoIIE family protein phosphatase [Saprospiraceae bacterium]
MKSGQKNKKSRKISFYFFIISVLSVSVIVLFTLLVNMSNTAESLAISLIDKTTGEANDQLDNYFDRIKGNLIATKQLGDQGILNPVDYENISSYYLPIFNTYPEINTILIANTKGNEYSIIREDTSWLTNVVFESVDSGMVIKRERWKGNLFDKEIINEWMEYNSSWDPRTRPWFIGAMNSEYPNEPWWTEPYVFFTDQVPGITASIKSFCPSTEDINIIQYDILLSNISEFTIAEKVSENSKTFVLTKDLKVIGLPSEAKFNNSDSIAKYVLCDYDSIGSNVLELAVLKWKEYDGNYSDAFSLKIDNEKWWVKITPFELGKNRKFLIGVAVPENDFLTEVKQSRNVVIGGFMVVLIIIIIVVRQYIVKRKMNLLLAQQKEQISKQRDEIHKQHEIVVEQKKEITDSINYAKKIQVAMLPAEDTIHNILGEHFILFKPKDIVSGDFFWATETNDWVIVTAADCTGHGVPGAFMSMLGISFLNEIVRKKEVINAADILNNLRSSIIEALKQTGEYGTQKDGMDMSIIAINKDRKRALWAGANNPLWIIRNANINKEFEDPKDRIEEIKADKMPVAVHVKMDEFTNHEIQVEAGDRLFLFSDGYPDQFGGPKGKKFMNKAFKRLLSKTSSMPMKQQGEQLKEELEKWMTAYGEHYEQLDDITVIGLKI